MKLAEILARQKPKLSGNPALALSPAPAKRDEYEPGKLVIRFESKALEPAAASLTANRPTPKRAAAAIRDVPEDVRGVMRTLREDMGARSVKAIYANRPQPPALKGASLASHLVEATRSVADSRHEYLAGITMVTVDEKAVTDAKMKKLQGAKGVRFVERIPTRYLAARQRLDPKVNAQWGLRAIDWFGARIPDASGVIVAVIDSGVDRSHPDLKRAVADYFPLGESTEDIVGHGTHVAGIIAATANNRVGIAGVANVKVKVWKVVRDVPPSTRIDADMYLQALGEVLDSDAKVVNLSLSGSGFGQLERDLIGFLVANRKIVVAAMGNHFETGNPKEFPAAYPDVIAVGAINVQLERASFSNTGAHITLVAPGEQVLSTLPLALSALRPSEQRYEFWDGTSMATPHVAGAAALLCARDGSLDQRAVMRRLAASAKPVPDMRGRKSTREFGRGLLHLPGLLR